MPADKWEFIAQSAKPALITYGEHE